MGTEFPNRCSRLPCRKGDKKIPFKPCGFNGIIAPEQPVNNPKYCSKYPNHITETMMAAYRTALRFKWFFNMMYFLTKL